PGGARRRGRRARHGALRRRAAADRDRAGPPPGPARARPGRGDLRDRHRDAGADRRHDRPAVRGPDAARREPPSRGARGRRHGPRGGGRAPGAGAAARPARGAMTAPVAVALVDSGVAADGPAVRARRAFALDAAGAVVAGPAGDDALGHGTALARLVAAAAPDAALLDAQVFGTTFLAPPAAVAAAIDWAVAAGARVVNLSFGLRADRDVLRGACARAVAAGVLLVAATPARGAPVFPASYPGVVRVSGDTRCGAGEVSD